MEKEEEEEEEEEQQTGKVEEPMGLWDICWSSTS